MPINRSWETGSSIGLLQVSVWTIWVTLLLSNAKWCVCSFLISMAMFSVNLPARNIWNFPMVFAAMINKKSSSQTIVLIVLKSSHTADNSFEASDRKAWRIIPLVSFKTVKAMCWSPITTTTSIWPSSPKVQARTSERQRQRDRLFLVLDGQLINALESKVKHAQCFDVALTDDGSVVLASKDYRIYVYRYLMTPSLMGSSNNGGPGSSTSPPSPLSSTSTTPNSSQMIGGECTSPSLINGHDESPLTISTSMASNGY